MSNATIRVTFGSAGAGAGAHLSAEIDSRDSGLNGGDTSFQPGDNAWFLIYKSNKVSVESIKASAGSVLSGGEQVFSRTEDLQFEDDDSASLPVPSDGISTVQWIGNDLGGLTLGADGMSIKAASKGVAIARVTFTVSPDAFAIQAPASVAGLVDFPILVLVKGAIDED